MKVYLDIDLKRGRVLLRTAQADWFPGLPTQCKSVPGWGWSKTLVAWTYPLSMTTLRRLRQEFGDALSPSEALLHWARIERRKEKRAKAYAAHHDASLAKVATISPVLAEAMESRTYQKSAAKFAKIAGSYLLADEPGLGKTATALAGLMESDLWTGSHLVSSPKTAIFSTWVRQVEMWTGASVYGMSEGKSARQAVWEQFNQDRSKTKFLILNPSMLRRQYGNYCKACSVWEDDVESGKAHFPVEHHTQRGHGLKHMVKIQDWPEIIDASWRSFIVDESHMLFAAYKPNNVSQTARGHLDVEAESKVCLTGTPLRGQEVNIWGTLDFLGVNTGGYWSFVESYMEYKKGFFGIEVFGVDPDKSDELYAMLDRYVLRRTRAEARPDLPPGQRFDVLIQPSSKHMKQYKQFEEDGEAAISGGMLSGQGLLSELTRLKQLSWGLWEKVGDDLVPTTDSAVYDWILEFLTTRGITGKRSQDWFPEEGSAYKVLIASQFTEIIRAIEKDLNRKGIKTLRIDGSVTGARRTDAQKKFQSKDKEHRVMLIQTSTGGVSIELDAWCDETVIIDETWVADDQVQLEGRTNNRSGRISPRSWWYLRVANTISQRVAERNYEQHDMQHKILDKRRGVDFALHLVRD